MRKISISENYEGSATPIRSYISPFSRGTEHNLDAQNVIGVTTPIADAEGEESSNVQLLMIDKNRVAKHDAIGFGILAHRPDVTLS